jgi:hypothetical protein
VGGIGQRYRRSRLPMEIGFAQQQVKRAVDILVKEPPTDG